MRRSTQVMGSTPVFVCCSCVSLFSFGLDLYSYICLIVLHFDHQHHFRAVLLYLSVTLAFCSLHGSWELVRYSCFSGFLSDLFLLVHLAFHPKSMPFSFHFLVRFVSEHMILMNLSAFHVSDFLSVNYCAHEMHFLRTQFQSLTGLQKITLQHSGVTNSYHPETSPFSKQHRVSYEAEVTFEHRKTL